MIIAIPRETASGEARVALVPDMAKRLAKDGITVRVEAGAGRAAGFPDDAYREAGAEVVEGARAAWGEADVLLKLHAPGPLSSGHEADQLKSGAVVIGLFHPYANPDAMRRLAERGVTTLSLDLLPRITRAQSMDVLSAMSTVAGYKAVLLSAVQVGRFFPMLVTAAGTLAPAKTLILGAGVAGLQAIATARRLGAVVEAFDVRAAAKEQVESLGAKFLEAPPIEDAETEGGYAKELTEEQNVRNRELIAETARRSHVIITTALIPGRPAPLLITEEAVRGMQPGSVIVDLAAEAGGNCALTKAGENVVVNDVTIMGPVNLAATMPLHASQMYSKNITTYLQHLLNEGRLEVNLDDEITGATCVTHGGKVVHDGVRGALDGGSGS